MSDNGTVTDKGVVFLRKMDALKNLRLGGLPGVADPEGVIKKIREDLPGCKEGSMSIVLSILYR